MDVRIGIPSAELQARRERLLEHVRGLGLTGFALFGADYIRYFTNFNFLATERPVAVVGNTTGDLAAFVPEFEVERVRAETPFELVESYPEYPGTEHPMRLLAGVLRELGVTGPTGADEDGYPGHPRLRRPAAERDHRAARDAARAVHREPDGAEERGRGGADPRERPLVRARAPVAAGVLAAGSDGGGGRPTGGPGGDAGAAGDARRLRTAASRPRPTASRRATAARSGCAARGRTRSPTTSASRRATSSSPRRPRRSGATTPNSSGR